MNMSGTNTDYLKALETLFYKMKGIKYWDLIEDMSGAEVMLLHTLAGTDKGSMQVGELTERLSMHPTSVSRLMNSLEKKGYIERSLHKGNRRITDVAVTDQGKEKFDENNRILNDYWDTVIYGLERDDLKNLLHASEELVKRMDMVYLERKGEQRKS